MKKFCMVLLCLLSLTGCAPDREPERRAIDLRAALLGAQGCSFDVEITADYGEEIYTFAMGCQLDAHGKLRFVVEQPDSIAGIAGAIDGETGELCFDGHVLSFPLLADGQLSPVSGPWLLYCTLTGGCLCSAVEEDGLLHLVMDDSYESDALRLDIWLGEQDLPVRAETLYAGRRILTLIVENFEIL